MRKTPRWSLADARLAREIYESGSGIKEARKRLSVGKILTHDHFKVLREIDSNPNYFWAEEVEVVRSASSRTECVKKVEEFRRQNNLAPRTRNSINEGWRKYRIPAPPKKTMPQSEEMALLSSIQNVTTFAAATRAYNTYAQKHGYPTKSRDTVRGKMTSLGIFPDARPPAPQILLCWVVAMSGLNYSSFLNWIDRGLLNTNRWRGFFTVTPAAFRAFLDVHYSRFSPKGLTPAMLRWLELDVQQIQRLTKVAGKRQTRRVQVGCMIHPDVATAAKALGITESGMRDRLRRGVSAQWLPPLPMHPITGPAAAAHRHLKTSFSRRVASYRAPKAQ